MPGGLIGRKWGAGERLPLPQAPPIQHWWWRPHFYQGDITVVVDNNFYGCIVAELNAGWSSLVARRAHNPKVRGSNPLSAIRFAQIAQSVEQRTENPRVGGSIPPLATIIFGSIPGTSVTL